MDFRKQQREHPPIHIDRTVGGKLQVPWHTNHRQTEMGHPHGQCGEEEELRRLKKFGLSHKNLTFTNAQ